MRTLFFFGFFLFGGLTALASYKTDSLILELDKKLDIRGDFQRKKEERIKSIKESLQKDKRIMDLHFRYEVYSTIYEEYKSYIYDSAFSYANKLLKIGTDLNDEVLISQSKIKLSFTLLSTGMFKEALDIITSVKDIDKLPVNIKLDYFSVYSRVFYDMADYAGDNHYVPLYNKQGHRYLDSALSLVKDNPLSHLSLLGLKFMRDKNIPNAIKTFTQLLNYNLSLHQKAIATSSLGYIYRLDNQIEKSIEMIAIASIADIQSSTKETVAIRELAELLYKNGDINRAYRYVQVALEDAYFYNAKHRKIQISNILPIIEGKQLEIKERQRQILLYYSIAVTILSVLVILFIIIILKQYKKLQQVKTSLAESHQRLQETNNKLEEVNKISEEYIGHFFNSISEYIEKIEKFKSSISRKVTAKRLDDISDIVNNINSHHERERLYSSFDSTFLKIFPGFVDKFNTLLKDEDRIIINEKHPLTPELRIFALIRLGISDNEKIAKTLGYSVNTIYTYKTRIKNRSTVPNDEFEKKLMEIKVV